MSQRPVVSGGASEQLVVVPLDVETVAVSVVTTGDAIHRAGAAERASVCAAPVLNDRQARIDQAVGDAHECRGAGVGGKADGVAVAWIAAVRGARRWCVVDRSGIAADTGGRTVGDDAATQVAAG